MRDSSGWYRPLVEEMRRQWPESKEPLTPKVLCEVELGLHLLTALLPNEPPEALWVLLAGYPFALPAIRGFTPEQKHMLSNARHLLPYYRGAYPWRRALARYGEQESRIRGFDVSASGVARRSVTLGARRFDIYGEVLSSTLNYRMRRLTWAEPGTYRISDGKVFCSVSIPEEVVPKTTPQGHELAGRRQRASLTVRWEELNATARWMDERLTEATGTASDGWEKRFSRVRLELLDKASGCLVPTDAMPLDGLFHLVGMVSSGKSTLMDVLAVWAARKGLHVTLIVGDVLGALRRAQQFQQMGLAAAPILGASNRERHLGRLHRTLADENPEDPFPTQHVGFRWLSTSCILDGLRSAAQPLPLQQYPCMSLREEDALDAAATEPRAASKLCACPFYGECAFHLAQHDLVSAQIWIATPASLIYTRVPAQLNREDLRFAELVYRRSDLVVADEADQIQIQLDSIFSPNQTLVSRRQDAWLSRLSQQVTPRINQEGRGQLREPRIAAWVKAHDLAQMAANQVYGMLLQPETKAPLLGRIERDYFTAWMLLERLAEKVSGTEPQQKSENPAYKRLMAWFEGFMDDPLHEKVDSPGHELVEVVFQLVGGTNEKNTHGRLRELLVQQVPEVVERDDLDEILVVLSFALSLEVLANRIDLLLRDWRMVEAELQLDGASSVLFHNPPEDYQSIMPASPMGNVLAFQYVQPIGDAQDVGDLRFFRCMGVGRWLLLHLHELFAGEHNVGPHVILMSGTSWAGTSPRFHIQVPVNGVLHAPAAEVQAISQSRFEFESFRDEHGAPIRVSGRHGQARFEALRALLRALVSRGGLKDAPSRLERERSQLPPERQRIMLLVGSYEEARFAFDVIADLRSDWRGQVRFLVPDDDDFSHQWMNKDHGLQRGRVQQFTSTGAWLLIAPLLAVERGHNILNDQGQAALGALYFLVRPLPRPDDLSYAIHSINHWAMKHYSEPGWGTSPETGVGPLVSTAGERFRRAAYKRWRALLSLPMFFSTLPDEEREALSWSQLVTIWQVIGRLVRGGCPAHVYFCDAAFAHRAAAFTGQQDAPASSLLRSMLSVLEPYFAERAEEIPDIGRSLVQTLYGPLYQALSRLEGIAHDV